MTLRQKQKFLPELSFDTIQTLWILFLYFSQWRWLTYAKICFLIHFYTHYISSRCNIVFQSEIEAVLSNPYCSIFYIMPMFFNSVMQSCRSVILRSTHESLLFVTVLSVLYLELVYLVVWDRKIQIPISVSSVAPSRFRIIHIFEFGLFCIFADLFEIDASILSLSILISFGYIELVQSIFWLHILTHSWIRSSPLSHFICCLDIFGWFNLYFKQGQW
jgi:hypothetical protein